MGDKLYSNDLKKILSYMVDILSKEFPTEVFSVEYLIVSILDNSKSHAYTLLDNCLMTSNLEELKNIYVNWLKLNRSDKNLVVKQENVNFNEELDRILTNAEKERENLKSILVGSEHVLLSMLNPDNKCEKIQEVFKNMGITYNFIIDKCSESSNKEKTNNAPKKIMKKPSMLPLKSEINQQGISSSNEYISKYTINLNQLAKEGKIDELVGRKKEIEKIIKIMARRKKNNVVLVGKGGCGKCLAKGTKILMYDGTYKNVEDVIIGDKLMGVDSTPRNVLSLGHGFDEMYEITQKNAMTYITNSEHILSLIGGNYNGLEKGKIYDIPIKEYLSFSKTKKENLLGYKSGIIHFQNKNELPIDPYFIGMWLGDGDSRRSRITNIDNDIINYIYEIAEKYDCKVTKNDITYNIISKNKGMIVEAYNDETSYIGTVSEISSLLKTKEQYIYDILNEKQKTTKGFKINYIDDGKNKINKILIELNLINNKHIPHIYLTSSLENRLKLLAGLIDTDGNVTFNKCGYEITQKNKTLFDNIVYLCNSLGLNTRITKPKIINNTTYYRLGIYGKLLENVPVRIERKKINNLNPNKNQLLTSIKVKNIGFGEYFGFELDGDRRFILEDFTVTHNTAIVNGIADMIVKDEVPQILKNKEVVMLDVMTLVSGTHFRGMFEERVNGLFNELKNSKNHILFIDDIQQILRSGSKEKDTDLSSWIGDILANGEVSVIATTTFKDYRNTIEINTSISRKLQKVVIEPTSIQETIEIIEKTKHYYEDFHNVTYDSDVVKKTVELSQRYITDRSLPDSAIDVIDLSGAYTCLIDREPQHISNMRKRLIKINKERSERLNKGDFEFIDSLNKEENFLKKNISDFNREVEKDKTKYSINITLDNIATSISDMTNIPINKLTLNEKEKIANIENVLKESVVGQDEAIEAVSRIIKRNKVGLGDKNKTLGNLLLLGPSGSGKTLIAKKLAEEIFGSDKALVRIDMSEYSEKNSVAKLTGAAPGYVGFENGGQLTEAIKNKQHCVLLLDEIEKADKEVYNLFLQLFDEGRLTDSAGQMVNFKNVIVLMTSNIGAKQASEMGKGLGFVTDESSNKKSIIEKSLKQTFTPEFINRIDQIVYFNSLSEDNLKEIVKLEINKFIKRLNELNYNLTYTEEVVEHLHSFAIKQKEYGARPIIRLIQDKIEDQITDLMLKNEYEENYTFVATYENEGIIIK